jgi:hypothetical protein
MTFDLKSIHPTRTIRPPRVLVYGPHKIGKSTFAAGWPGAIFIPTEDGQDSLDASSFPLCHSWNDILAAIGTLYNESHEFETVVLDSVDWAESLCFEHTCRTVKTDKGVNPTSIEGYGYGKGYGYAADVFRTMLSGLNALRDNRGMAIVVIAHSEIKRYDDPLSDSYDRHQIKLQKQLGKMLQEWVDVVGFASTDVYVRKEGVGYNKEVAKATTSDVRKLHLVGGAAFDAGNRFGMPASVDLNYAAFLAALKGGK